VFTEETRKIIARVLHHHLENERTVELLRQGLQENGDFNVREVFNGLDGKNDGYLTVGKVRDQFFEGLIDL